MFKNVLKHYLNMTYLSVLLMRRIQNRSDLNLGGFSLLTLNPGSTVEFCAGKNCSCFENYSEGFAVIFFIGIFLF